MADVPSLREDPFKPEPIAESKPVAELVTK